MVSWRVFSVTFLVVIVITVIGIVESALEPPDEDLAHRMLSEVAADYEMFKINTLRLESPSRYISFLTKTLIKSFQAISPFQFVQAIKLNLQSKAYCLFCEVVASVVTNSVFSKGMISYVTNEICVGFKMQSPVVCESMIRSVEHVVDHIRLNTKLAPSEMCGVLLGSQCHKGDSDKIYWTIPIPQKIKWPARLQKKQGRPVKFAQITDIHLDEQYLAGANANCGDPLCCRSSNGYSVDPISAAGNWADYRNCDVNDRVLKDAISDCRQSNPDLDFVLWSGDNPSHNVWDITQDQVKTAITTASEPFEEFTKNGIKVYPIVGNHEGVPINCFAPEDLHGTNFSSSWLFDFAAEKWSKFLPASALETFRKGGHYRLRLTDNLVLLAVNSNYCARLNLWNFYDPVDPGGQLAWMTEQLTRAEYHGDAVHMVMHIAPDNRECAQAWLFNYLRICERFQNTIKGQYFGHTHRAEFRVIYTPEDVGVEKPIGVLLIAPSIVSYSQTNPAYRIVKLDKDANIDNYADFYANLTTANSRGFANWEKAYDARSFHNISGHFDGPAYHDVTQRLGNDVNSFNDFYRNVYVVKSDAPEMSVCDDETREAVMDDLTVDHPFAQIKDAIPVKELSAEE